MGLPLLAEEAETQRRRWWWDGYKEGLGKAKETLEDTDDRWKWKRDGGEEQCIIVVKSQRRRLKMESWRER